MPGRKASKAKKRPSRKCDCCGKPSYVMKATGSGFVCDECVIEKDGTFFKLEECQEDAKL
jgi:hypothetical protein